MDRRALLAALLAGAVVRDQELGAQAPSTLVLDFGSIEAVTFTFGSATVTIPTAAIVRTLKGI